MASFKEYRRVVNYFKKYHPPAFPVSVRRVRMRLGGICIRDNKKFIIKINNKLLEHAAIDTFLHEYAHAMAWSHRLDAANEADFDKLVHDATWGVAYAELYRIYDSKLIECNNNYRFKIL